MRKYKIYGVRIGLSGVFFHPGTPKRKSYGRLNSAIDAVTKMQNQNYLNGEFNRIHYQVRKGDHILGEKNLYVNKKLK